MRVNSILKGTAAALIVAGAAFALAACGVRGSLDR